MGQAPKRRKGLPPSLTPRLDDALHDKHKQTIHALHDTKLLQRGKYDARIITRLGKGISLLCRGLMSLPRGLQGNQLTFQTSVVGCLSAAVLQCSKQETIPTPNKFNPESLQAPNTLHLATKTSDDPSKRLGRLPTDTANQHWNPFKISPMMHTHRSINWLCRR